MAFKIGDRVKVSREYPADSDHPIAHADEAAMWGLMGDVIGKDDKYVFVMPYGLFSAWPRKERFDPIPHWHFLPEELSRIQCFM